MMISELDISTLFQYPDSDFVQVLSENTDHPHKIVTTDHAIFDDTVYQPFRSFKRPGNSFHAKIVDDRILISYHVPNSTAIKLKIGLPISGTHKQLYNEWSTFLTITAFTELVDNLYLTHLHKEDSMSKTTRMLSDLSVGSIFYTKPTGFIDIIKSLRSSSTPYPIKGVGGIYVDAPCEPFYCTARPGNYFYAKIEKPGVIQIEYYYGKSFPYICLIDYDLPAAVYVKTFIENVEASVEKLIYPLLEEAELETKQTTRTAELEELSNTYKPSTVIINEPANVTININKDSSITDKFTTIIGSLSSIVDNINAQTSLGSQKELADAFVKAKLELTKATEVSTNFVTQYLSEKEWYKKLKNNAITVKAKSDTVKKNIDSLFGLMHEKYNTLISVAESLQESLAILQAQVVALKDLEKESDELLAQYAEGTIPTRDLAMNTQIKASVLKYQDRITKVKGSITAMQATIVALGRDLPAHKADLEDEMAISGLLSNVDDYQQMFTQIKELVTTVTDSTRAKTFQVVDNLMKMQIEDTHTVKALQANVDSGSKFAKMLSTHADTLATKAVRDAKIIKDLAQQSYKQITG